jgi:hypothetical protein
MAALDAAAVGDAPEQLIGPKREIACLPFARIECLIHCVRARSIQALCFFFWITYEAELHHRNTNRLCRLGVCAD